MSVVILGGIVVLVAAAMAASSRWSISAQQGHRTLVPVDDFVVGDLPMICSRSGRPADGLVGVESNEGAFQAWWLLLLFLGPLGVVAIILLWTLARRPGRVGGSVPMTRQALAEQNRAIRLANWAWVVPVVAFVVGAAILLAPADDLAWLPVTHESIGVGVLLFALVGGFATSALLSVMATRRQVSVALDGTARWVEIRNVHPDFARAVDEQVRHRHRAARHDTAHPDSPR